MKIRNLIYGTAVVCLFSTFLISEPSAQSLSTASVSVNECGNSPRWQGTQCISSGKGRVPNYCCSSTLTLTESPNSYGGEYTGDRVEPMPDPVVPDEPQETCETKEINGDITSCCHTESSSGSTGVRDLFNTQSGNNINIQNMNTVNGGI